VHHPFILLLPPLTLLGRCITPSTLLPPPLTPALSRKVHHPHSSFSKPNAWSNPRPAGQTGALTNTTNGNTECSTVVVCVLPSSCPRRRGQQAVPQGWGLQQQTAVRLPPAYTWVGSRTEALALAPLASCKQSRPAGQQGRQMCQNLSRGHRSPFQQPRPL
jgi:hypothetical protein